jgi:hypothetical protein
MINPFDSRFYNALAKIRERLGPPPRAQWWEHEEFRRGVTEPYWAQISDFHIWFLGYRWLARSGRITWACIVQANNGLFREGSDDLPAAVVYAEDDFAGDVEPAELLALAEELFGLKGTTPSRADEREVAFYLTDEHSHIFGCKVPASFGPSRDYRLSCIFIPRSSLPHGMLRQKLFPIFIAPDGRGLVSVIPSKFWPKELLEYWGAYGEMEFDESF